MQTTINDEILYRSITDGRPLTAKNDGIQALKDFHLKNARIYDNELKDKIFFIG